MTEIPQQLADLTRKIAEGQAAEAQRADLIRSAYQADPKTWTQTRLAKEAGISQAAVSKLLRQPMMLRLHAGSDKPGWLLGRFIGLADWTDDELYARDITTTWGKTVEKILSGTLPPVDVELERIEHGLCKDLAKLPQRERVLVREMLDDIKEQSGGSRPAGAVRMTQQQGMWFLLGEMTQKNTLNKA
jgi:hypothetical protein